MDPLYELSAFAFCVLRRRARMNQVLGGTNIGALHMRVAELRDIRETFLADSWGDRGIPRLLTWLTVRNIDRSILRLQARYEAAVGAQPGRAGFSVGVSGVGPFKPKRPRH